MIRYLVNTSNMIGKAGLYSFIVFIYIYYNNINKLYIVVSLC